MQSIARVGAWAGFVTVFGVLAYHLTLAVGAGQRVSGTRDAAAITAYYGQDLVATASLLAAVNLPSFAVFVVAFREVVGRTTERARFLATVGLVAATVELAGLLTMLAAQAALVEAVRSGLDPSALFRFWDVLYNSLTYSLEATFVAAFGLAMRDAPYFPRWMSRFSLATAALLAANVPAIWIGVPDAATLPSAGFIAVWFVGTSIGLARAAGSVSASLAEEAAPA